MIALAPDDWAVVPGRGLLAVFAACPPDLAPRELVGQVVSFYGIVHRVLGVETRALPAGVDLTGRPFSLLVVVENADG